MKIVSQDQKFYNQGGVIRVRIKSGDTRVGNKQEKIKAKKGKVLEVITSKDKALVEGVNVAT